MSESPVRVLLVDDEIGFLDVLAKRMGKRGYAVTTAGSGAEGIQVLRGNDFDVAVLDLKLEDMDGIEVLQIMKKMVPDLPVIMLTGHGSEQAAREGVKSGAFDYLLKPCALDDLLDKIGEAAAGTASSQNETE
ncbi:response regulator [Pseudodesulfovibrio indicus]|jgi:DNA-binding NtrC family response regulator|uniref:Response regulator receiver domain-containing protein n=1 Tax=Pseudodesulfovibrio indicus TaxID=1716143 RepID=A0A126QT66_9BACT|nr:response regulator [Pseudodesulfovibrio indicus]AMK12635.1 two-component system response regulator [Pseudodesulfovibrio indicus]TDT90947.1 response regulator receiver domain-containing protein [Pseudodesulfovibrio indicus]